MQRTDNNLKKSTGWSSSGLSLAEMELIVDTFERRVDESRRSGAPTKDLVGRAIRRKGAERCPVYLKRLSLDIIVRHGEKLADLFSAFPDDVIRIVPYDMAIGYQGAGRADRVNPIAVMTQKAEWTDEWGTRWGHADGGVGASPVAHPLADWSGLDEYLSSRIPDPRAPGRLDTARRVLEKHGETKYCIGMIHFALFERLHSLRGMQNTFLDFVTNERQVERLADALMEYLIELIRSWGEIGADAVFLTDDWGTQTSLMISVEMWRRFFKARYRQVFDEVHRLGMDVIFHSCGNVTGIIPDLIDIGLDALDPIQPGAMDIRKIARDFGGKIAFFGAIDDQHLLTSCPPEKVRDEVRRTIDILGRPFGNAFVIAPANVMTPEVPIENLQALFEACHSQ